MSTERVAGDCVDMSSEVETSHETRVNFFNKQVCHHIGDRHFLFSFLIRHKGKNT